MRNLAAELALDGHARKKTSKTFSVRLTVYYRTATLRPFQDEGLAFLEAVYLNAPRRRREGSVLGGIGRKFMQQQREATHVAAGDRGIRSIDAETRPKVSACARARAPNRSRIAAAKPSGVSAVRALRVTTLLASVNRFFTRWSISRRRSCCCSCARLRSVMSRAIFDAAAGPHAH